MFQEDENSIKICSTLSTSLSKRKIAKHFKKAGWPIRKSGWDEYEIESEQVELELYGDSEILMSGYINDYKITILSIISVLEQYDIAYNIECYDQKDNLLEKYVKGKHK